MVSGMAPVFRAPSPCTAPNVAMARLLRCCSIEAARSSYYCFLLALFLTLCGTELPLLFSATALEDRRQAPLPFRSGQGAANDDSGVFTLYEADLRATLRFHLRTVSPCVMGASSG